MKVDIEWSGKSYEIDTDQRVFMEDNGVKTAMLYMPGLPCPVMVNVSGPHPVWSWNGDVFNPTFSPSILTQLPWGEDQHQIRNHVFVKKRHDSVPGRLHSRICRQDHGAAKALRLAG